MKYLSREGSDQLYCSFSVAFCEPRIRLRTMLVKYPTLKGFYDMQGDKRERPSIDSPYNANHVG